METMYVVHLANEIGINGKKKQISDIQTTVFQSVLVLMARRRQAALRSMD